MKQFLLILSMSSIFISCEKEMLSEQQTAEEYAMMAVTVSTKIAKNYNHFFTRYGNGWTGGDATYSVPLPDGRIVWMFGDSFLDTVYADRSRPASSLIRNVFMIQDGTNYNAFTTLTGGTEESPEAVVNTPYPAEAWYWPGDGTTDAENLYVYMMYFISTGTGSFDFAYMKTDLVKFSLPTFEEISRTTVWDEDNDVMFGAAVMEDSDYLYIYGAETAGFFKYVQLARVHKINLYEAWEYYNANTSSWQSTFPGINGRLKKNGGGTIDVSAQFSVFFHEGKYRLVTQEGLFGREIYTWESTSPAGQWKSKKKFYTTPEDPEELYTYNAFVHPEITNAAGYMLLSYNLNAINFFDLFSNADTYRPKFIWIKYL